MPEVELMRLIYCDPNLRTNAGHFFSHCQGVVSGARSLGVQTAVYTHQATDPSLTRAFGFQPTFRLHSHTETSADPLCGRLKSYLDVAKSLGEDLLGIPGIDRNDILLFDASAPAAIAAVTHWMESRAETCPRVVVSLHDFVELEVARTSAGSLEARPVSAQSALYRLAGLSIPPAVASRLAFVTCYKGFASVYSRLIRQTVHPVPHPFAAATAPRSRAGKRPIVIGFIGAQQIRKGFGIVPELTRRLLSDSLPIEVCIHDCFGIMQSELEQLAKMAIIDNRISITNGAVDATAWAQILDRCDLLVAPYDPRFFALNNSGVISEAIANGIPIAVPEHTTLSDLLRDYEFPGVAFPSSTVEDVAKVVRHAIQNYDNLAVCAAKARHRWATVNGPQEAARAVLQLFESPSLSVSEGAAP